MREKHSAPDSNQSLLTIAARKFILRAASRARGIFFRAPHAGAPSRNLNHQSGDTLMLSTFISSLQCVTTEFHWQQTLTRLMARRLLDNLVLSLILSIFLCGWLSTTCAQSKTQLTPEENEVLTQVGLGKEVDLQPFAQGQAGQDQKRGEISAEFLVNLLVNEDNKFQITSEGITIKNALIRNRFNLGNRTIPANVTFTNCVFQDNAGFGMSNFERSLTIKDSVFAQEANFSDMKVAYFVDM